MMKLKENPDNVVDPKHHLNLKFCDFDAQTFIYRPTDKVMVAAPSKKSHHHMLIEELNGIGDLFHNAVGSDDIDDFNTYCSEEGLEIHWDESAELLDVGGTTLQLYGDQKKIVRWAKNLYRRDINVYEDDYREMIRDVGIQGRYWSDTEVSSFWLPQRILAKLIFSGHMDDYFHFMGLNKANARLNSIEDGMGVYTIDDLRNFEKKKPVSKIDREEELKLMRIQHLDPEAKKKLSADSDKPNKYGKILPAQYHAWSRTSDGVIRLGDILSEIFRKKK